MTSIVKMMKEQGNQFDWSQVALDFAGLPCFKQGEDLPSTFNPEEDDPTIFLADGYTIVEGCPLVVKITGEEPSVTRKGDQPVFTDCEPVVVNMTNLSPLSPVRVFGLDESSGTPVLKVSDTLMMAVSDEPRRSIFWLDDRIIPGAVVFHD